MDYVIYDKANDHVLKFGNGEVILFADINDALEDCRGNESVYLVSDLPQHWIDIVQNQIEKNNQN